MRHRPAALLAIALTAATAGCYGDGSTPAPGPSPTPSGALPEAAVLVRDFDDDLSARFGFARVIGTLLTSAGIADTPANREALVATLTASYNGAGFANPASGLAMPVTVRAGEAGLSPAALLDAAKPDGMVPIGLFNRIDLAPGDWSDCGEHRIVFGLKKSNPLHRFLLIFEAKLPNPDPAQGMKGCLKVAEQWRTIGAAAPAARNAALEQLYFAGLPGFRPVVHYLNYGSFLGQVRANAFIEQPWQLREFRVLPVAAQTLAFVPGPVASNPLAEFYKNNPIGTPLEQAERTAFQSDFDTTYVEALRSFDERAPATLSQAEFEQRLINCLGAGFKFRHNEFQSVSQGTEDEPAALAGTVIKASIPASWTAPGTNRTISRDELLNRAGTVTCGGCHQFSQNKPIGKVGGTPVNWPVPDAANPQFFFVHISEAQEGGTSGPHVISDTLRNFFIPFRKQVTAAVLTGDNPGKLCAVPPAPIAAAPAAPGPSRTQAETLAQSVLSGGFGAAPGGGATQLRQLAEDAHAADAQKRGAFVEFRRPH